MGLNLVYRLKCYKMFLNNIQKSFKITFIILLQFFKCITTCILVSYFEYFLTLVRSNAIIAECKQDNYALIKRVYGIKIYMTLDLMSNSPFPMEGSK